MEKLETVIKKFCKSNAGKTVTDFNLFKNPEELYKQFGTEYTLNKFKGDILEMLLEELFLGNGYRVRRLGEGGNDGDPYKEIKRSFATALRKAEICNATFHSLRHTFASHLVMNGVDLTTVKELLGHKSLNMTLRYSHLAPEHRTKAVKVLDNVFKNTVKKCNNTGKNIEKVFFSSHFGSHF